MSTFKQKTIDGIIDREGGYVNDPSDSGGETNFGITIKVARAGGYQGDMKDLSRLFAYNIYLDEYWNSVKGNELSVISPEIAEEVVDTCVNCGRHTASRFLQQSLNVMNRSQELYIDVLVDGRIGDKTIAALRGYCSSGRNIRTLSKALNCLQGAKYIQLALNREKDEKFVYGWLDKRVNL